MRQYQLGGIFGIFALLFASLAFASSASEEVYFAGDHYKVKGSPDIEVMPVNSQFHAGENTKMELILANGGTVDELVPSDLSPGSDVEAAQEMIAEFDCVNAINLVAQLRSQGPIDVLSDPVRLESLVSGDTATLEFDLIIGNGAEGVYNLLLDLEYEHQIDVIISGGGYLSPLYIPIQQMSEIEVEVVGDNADLNVAATKSELRSGEEGSLVLAIRNDGGSIASNCVIWLAVDPPLFLEDGGDHVFLGDIGPKEMKLIDFNLTIDDGVTDQEYQLQCEILYDQDTSFWIVPVMVKGPNKLDNLVGPFIFVLLVGILVVVAAFIRPLSAVRNSTTIFDKLPHLFDRLRRPRRVKSLRKRRTLKLPKWPFK